MDTLSGPSLTQLLGGFAWGLGSVWVLTSLPGIRVFSSGYSEAIARERRASVPWWSSVFFYGPAVALLTVVVLAFAAAAL